MNGEKLILFVVSVQWSNILFAGILHPSKREIAMKFTLPSPGADAKHEFKIYSYLDAINRTEVEKYGIPCILYYGQYQDCQMLGMSLLDPEFNKRYKNLNVTDIDVLILCREFVSNPSFSPIVAQYWW